MRKLSVYIFTLVLTFATMASFISGCGDDSGVVNTGGSGWPPTFTFTPGQTFVYNNDSIANPNGVPSVIHTSKLSTDIVQAQITVDGHLCYPFAGQTVDTVTQVTVPELYNIYYDPAGKYYHYGIRQLINPAQPQTWDLIGDFSVGRGTTYTIGNISYTLPLPQPYGSILFTGPLTGVIKNEDSTTITTKFGETIYCYRIEMTASISGMWSNLPIAANINLDYYVGYTTTQYPTNPAGLVRLNLKPFTFTVNGTPIPSLSEPGYDRYLRNHNP